MTPPRLVAVDLSLTATGLAWTHNAGRQPVGVRTATPRSRGHERLFDLTTAVAELCRSLPDLAVIEGASYASQGSARWQLAELHGLIKQWLWTTGIPYVLIAPQSRAKYATGRGNAGKDEVMLAVARRYAGVATVANNNEADALALLAMACDHYGAPLAVVPHGHASALVKVDWPALTESPGPGEATSGVHRPAPVQQEMLP